MRKVKLISDSLVSSTSHPSLHQFLFSFYHFSSTCSVKIHVCFPMRKASLTISHFKFIPVLVKNIIKWCPSSFAFSSVFARAYFMKYYPNASTGKMTHFTNFQHASCDNWSFYAFVKRVSYDLCTLQLQLPWWWRFIQRGSWHPRVALSLCGVRCPALLRTISTGPEWMDGPSPAVLTDADRVPDTLQPHGQTIGKLHKCYWNMFALSFLFFEIHFKWS